MIGLFFSVHCYLDGKEDDAELKRNFRESGNYFYLQYQKEDTGSNRQKDCLVLVLQLFSFFSVSSSPVCLASLRAVLSSSAAALFWARATSKNQLQSLRIFAWRGVGQEAAQSSAWWHQTKSTRHSETRRRLGSLTLHGWMRPDEQRLGRLVDMTAEAGSCRAWTSGFLWCFIPLYHMNTHSRTHTQSQTEGCTLVYSGQWALIFFFLLSPASCRSG